MSKKVAKTLTKGLHLENQLFKQRRRIIAFKPAYAILASMIHFRPWLHYCRVHKCYDIAFYYILCGYQCDKAVNKNDTREVI